MPTEVNPDKTSRAYAFKMWMNAPMPMVTFIKNLRVERLLKYSRRNNMKFNMLMCWCIGKAATTINEFMTLSVNGKLIKYDSLAINTILLNSNGELTSCDIPFSNSIETFNREYLRLTEQAAKTCTDYDLSNQCMVIGTSALANYDIDAAIGMYSGIFNNPFMIWGRYRRNLFKTTLTVSFQFHHTQMDGAHAAAFLNNLQREIYAI